MVMAGSRNRRITLYRVTETNTKGETTDVLTSLGQRWAGRRNASVSEQERADQTIGASDYVYTLPYDAMTNALVPKDRLVESSDTYDIVGASDPDGRRKEIRVYVRRFDT